MHKPTAPVQHYINMFKNFPSVQHLVHPTLVLACSWTETARLSCLCTFKGLTIGVYNFYLGARLQESHFSNHTLISFPNSISLPKPSSPVNPLSSIAMAPPLPLALKPQPQTLTLTLRSFSSSPPHFPDSNPNTAAAAAAANNDQTSSLPPPNSSYSSLFSDIKERLKSPPSPPRRIPDNPSPPPHPPQPPAASLHDIRKRLAEFRLNSPNPNPDNNSNNPGTVPSFQQLFKNNAMKNDAGASSGGGGGGEQLSFDSIRDSLRQFRSSPSQPSNFRSQVSYRPSQTTPAPLVGDQEKLSGSIFGKEEGETKTMKTEFLKIYSYDELGEKLRGLRPEEAEKGGKDWFSLEELNERLAKLREMEDEMESRMGGLSFRDLRDSLMRLKEIDAGKKANSKVFFPFFHVSITVDIV